MDWRWRLHVGDDDAPSTNAGSASVAQKTTFRLLGSGLEQKTKKKPIHLIEMKAFLHVSSYQFLPFGLYMLPFRLLLQPVSRLIPPCLSFLLLLCIQKFEIELVLKLRKWETVVSFYQFALVRSSEKRLLSINLWLLQRRLRLPLPLSPVFWPNFFLSLFTIAQLDQEGVSPLIAADQNTSV